MSHVCVCVGGYELEDLAFRVVGTELDCSAEKVEAIHFPRGREGQRE